MKKILHSLIVGLGTAVGLTVFAAVYVFGQAAFIPEKNSGTFLDQLKSTFVDQADALLIGITNPRCTDNYTSWPNSLTFKADSPWSTTFVIPQDATTNITYNNFERDINGDGLNDYFYIKHVSSGVNIQTFDCVYLSNGSGWQLAYRCVATGNPFKYYGDCAG